MKKIFMASLLAASMAQSQATNLTLNGTLSWNVTEPRCTFQLTGKLINGTNQPSGTLKLSLFGSQNPFPAPGFLVSESVVGTIAGGYEAQNFTVSSPSKIPNVSGSFIFTVIVSEYIQGTWRNVLTIPSGTSTLKSGDFINQPRWSLPTATILPPVARLGKKATLQLNLKATDELYQFPANLQERTELSIDSASKLTRKFRGARAKASYLYKVKNATYNGMLASCGVITVKLSPTTKSTITLFYQSAKSGTYKSVDVTSSGTATTWGSFKLL